MKKKNALQNNIAMRFFMRPTGFEPAAFGVGVQRAIHLRHERLYMKNAVTAHFNLVK